MGTDEHILPQDYRDIALAHVMADFSPLKRASPRSWMTSRAIASWRSKAIHVLHDLTRDRDRLRDQHHRLRDEYRALREHLLQTVAA